MAYPLVFQKQNNDCGPACIYTLCQYYSISCDKRKIMLLTKLTPKGASIWDMQVALKSLGFSCEAVYIQDICHYDYILPVIAITEVKNSLLHYVIIYKKTENSLLIGDPALGIQEILVEAFIDKFTNMVIIPKYKI